MLLLNVSWLLLLSVLLSLLLFAFDIAAVALVDSRVLMLFLFVADSSLSRSPSMLVLLLLLILYNATIETIRSNSQGINDFIISIRLPPFSIWPLSFLMRLLQ